MDINTINLQDNDCTYSSKIDCMKSTETASIARGYNLCNSALSKILNMYHGLHPDGEDENNDLTHQELVYILKYLGRRKNLVYRKVLEEQIIKGISWKLPAYKQKFSDYGDQWYRTSSLYANSGNIHTDRRLTIIPRQTQGMGMIIMHLAEAVTSVSSFLSYYLLYQSGKNVYNAIESHSSILPPLDVINFMKRNFIWIGIALSVLLKWYKGKTSNTEAMLALTGVFAASQLFPATQFASEQLVTTIMSMLKPVPANLIPRETQGFEPTTLAENIISVILLLGMGSTTTLDAKSVMNSIKGLSAIILTVKTIENVFIHIITYLPDIIQVMISEKIPSFGLYVKLATDKKFREFMNKINEFRAMDPFDVMYNSHNLATFLNLREYCIAEVLTEVGLRQGLEKLIPKQIEWIDETYDKCEKYGLLPGRRAMPYVIWISGEPGIGKSTLVHQLAESILVSALGQPMRPGEYNKYVYAHNTSNKYFDGYNNQPIFVLNDYLQFATENEEQWLIRFTDSIDCPLEVSSVDNIATGVKGEVRFTSRIIIVTSNISHLQNSTCVTNLDAFNRRRNVVIDMRWKPNCSTVDLNNFNYSWCDIKIMRSVLGHTGYLDNPLDAKRLIDGLCAAIERFITFGRIGHMSSEEFLAQTTLSGKLRKMNIIKEDWNSTVEHVWKNVCDVADTAIFGIKIKFLIPLTLVGSATYLMYKSWIPAIVEKITQSMSGDMATQRIQRKLKPLTRTTMGNRQNDSEFGLKIMNNVVRITTTIRDPNDRLMNQTMWGWSTGGSLVFTPKHLWMRGDNKVKDGDAVKIKRSNQEFDFYVNDKNVYLFPDTDIAVINVLGYTPPFKSINQVMIDGNAQVDTAGEDAVLILPTETNDILIPVMMPVRAYLTDAPYRDEYGTEYEGSNIWQYNQRMMKGDCGAVMCIKTKNGLRIAGMHVAGDAFSGNAEIVSTQTFKDAERFFKTKEAQGFLTDVELTEDEFFDAESDLEGNFFFLGKAKKAPFQKSDTQIVRSPLYEALQPHKTEPAVLSPTDKRMNEICSPMLKSVAKYGVPVVPFQKQLMDEAFDIVKSFYNPMKRHELHVFEYDDAINSTYTPNLEKIDLATSAGYPWNTKGITKRDLVEVSSDGRFTLKPDMRAKVEKNDEYLSNNVMFPYTLVTTLKDERVSTAKVKIGKTRTFMNFPFEYTVLMRKYFDDFIDKETLYAMEIGTTVGVNIYSSLWHELFQTLDRFDYTTDGDFKAFDGTIRPEFFRYYAMLVNSMYRDSHGDKRMMLSTGCCFAPMFVLDKVYMKLQGNPSGSRLTTSFNSFVNRMYVVMSMIKVLPEHFRNQQFFKDNVKIFAHGDDHIIGFNQIVMENWDALVLQAFMKQHNIEYTSSSKNEDLKPYRKLYDCYYLKSYFVYNNQTRKYQAGLDKEVIQEMVSWQRDDNIKSTEMIVQTALRYAYFWGYKYFESIYTQLEKVITERHLDITLIDYNSLEQYYLYNGQMDFSYV